VIIPFFYTSLNAMHISRSHDAVIRVYDAAGNVIDWAKKRTQAGFMLDS
jgi:hypothetical protein